MIIENDKTKRVQLCNKCLKRIKKDLVDGKKPFAVLAYYSAKPKPAPISEAAPATATA